MLYAIVTLIVIILDQISKYWITEEIAFEVGSKTLIPGILSLVNVHNDGAAFSFLSGSNARLIFIGICVGFCLLVIIALATRLIKGRFARWCAVLVMAGGIGNCIDRALYGYVVDMFKVEFFNFPVFNVADIFITLFCLLFIFCIIFGGRHDDYDDYDDEDYDEEEEEDDEEEELEDEEDPREARKAARRAKKEARRQAKLARYEEDEDDEDEEEDEEEEEPAPKPSRKDRRAAKKAARAARYEEDEDEEDEEEEEPVAPKISRSRKARQQENMERLERLKAESEPAPIERSNAPQAAAPAEDPFAEWEKANARIQAEAPAAEPAPVPAPKAEPAPAPAPAPKAEPAPALAPAPKAEPAPAKSAEDEFSLDDILAEFR